MASLLVHLRARHCVRARIVNLSSLSEDLLECHQGVVKMSERLRGHRMKIWHFAILGLLLGLATWFGSLVYKGIIREIELAGEHQLM
jgi:hypothetical protein